MLASHFTFYLPRPRGHLGLLLPNLTQSSPFRFGETEAQRRKITRTIHIALSDRNVIDRQGSLLAGQRSRRDLTASLGLCLGLQELFLTSDHVWSPLSFMLTRCH